MTITTDTRPNVSQKPTLTQPANDASFWAAAVPGNVRGAAGIPNGATGTFGDGAVAFTMTHGARKDTLVWDKASDALYVKQGKSFVKASDETRAAFMARIDDPELRAVRRGSTYDGLRRDVLEAQRGTRSELTNPKLPKKEPELPKTEAKTADLYADPDKPESVKPTDVKPQVEVKEPQVKTEVKPEAVKPTDVKPQVEVKKPQVKTEVKPEAVKPTDVKPQVEVKRPEAVKPTELSRADFVKEMSDKGIAANAPVRGLQVAKADLNADGVIRGEREANALFDELNRVEKAKTGPATVTLGEKRVQSAVDDLRAAPGNQAAKARYGADALEGMATTIEHGGYVNDAAWVGGGKRDYLGRAVSPNAIAVRIGDKEPVTVVHDPKLGFLKAHDGKALVPMTHDEIQQFKKNYARPDDFGNEADVVLWNRLSPNDKVMSGEIAG